MDRRGFLFEDGVMTVDRSLPDISRSEITLEWLEVDDA